MNAEGWIWATNLSGLTQIKLQGLLNQKTRRRPHFGASYVLIVILLHSQIDDYGDLLGMETWDPGNTGKRTILITCDPRNTGKRTILITREPGNIGKRTMLITCDPGNIRKHTFSMTCDP